MEYPPCASHCSACRTAWDSFSPEGRWRVHGEWMAKTRQEIKGCVVDAEARDAKETEIEIFKTKYGPRLKKLDGDIRWLEDLITKKKAKYAEARAPLDALEAELEAIVEPAKRKRRLQADMHKEKDWARDQ